MYGVSLNEVINSVLQKDLELEDARVRTEREERRLLALQQSVDANVIVGTDALVARISEGLEEKLGISPGAKSEEAPIAAPVEERPNVTHFPPPPRLGGTK